MLAEKNHRPTFAEQLLIHLMGNIPVLKHKICKSTLPKVLFYRFQQQGRDLFPAPSYFVVNENIDKLFVILYVSPFLCRYTCMPRDAGIPIVLFKDIGSYDSRS